ncbi:MAG: tetratricopeptide repeat protein [Bryobacteraceae bacterium]
MLGAQFRALFLFYVNPRKAASAVLDHGKLLFAVVAAVVVSLAISTAATAVESAEFTGLMESQAAIMITDQATFEQFRAAQQSAARQLRGRYFATGVKGLLVLAAVFVPLSILLLAAWDHLGGGMTILFRDYMPALAGLLFAWTAAHLPFAVLWWSPLASPPMAVPLQLGGLLFFLLLASQVLATVTGASLSHSASAAVAGVAASAGASLFFANSSGLLYMLASPWVLFYGYRMFGGDIAALGGGLSERQNFKRQLELATINPRDADAHYQLGLIYVQRRLPAEAEERFRRALEIDPNEPDALFQLGRLLRQQEGRGEEARQLLERGAALDPKLSSHEVWRELGAIALSAGRLDEALKHLSHYAAVREYDPEGLVLYGQALNAAQRPAEAKAAFEQAIESVKGAPKFRRRELSRWESQARQELRAL